MPGLVLYADNNSRITQWELQDSSGRVVGHTRRSLRPVGRGRLFQFGSDTVYVPSPFRYEGQTMNAYTDERRSEQVGTMRRVPVLDASGAVSLKNDASGMFRRIPSHLREYMGASEVISRPFLNVHDDAEEGGTQADTRANFFRAFDGAAAGLRFFVYCGHGSRDGLESACVTSAPGRQQLARVLAGLLVKNSVVMLAACSTGQPGGFAQQLSQELAGLNVTVWGHTSSGSASTNPTKVSYRAGELYDLRSHLSATARQRWNGRHLPHRVYLMAPFWSPEQLEREVAGA